MAASAAVSVDPTPIIASDSDFGLSVPPFDTAFFFQQLNDDGGAFGDNQNDDIDFDFSFDDLDLPSADDLDDLLNPNLSTEFDCQPPFDANFPQFAPNAGQFDYVFESGSSKLLPDSLDGEFSVDRSSNVSGLLNSMSSGLESNQVYGCLNVVSPESNGSNRGTSKNCGTDVKVVGWPSPESAVSGNCGSNVSEDRSVNSLHNSSNSSIRDGFNQKIESVELSKNKVYSSSLKRKKDCEHLPDSTMELKINKCRKPNSNSENNNNHNDCGGNEVDEKRKTRLVRNRESAQLSRQRKKQYVEELEDKVKTLHSTIQELNKKISFFMAENTTLRQQMSGGGAVPPPSMVPPPTGMYPHPSMMYTWMPYASPYMMKPQGSQVPLVPIPRLKPQQKSELPKVNKKVESKKKEGSKTKKVASVSFLGVLFFIFLFGGLAPMINMRYGGVRETLTGGESYPGGGFYENTQGRVLMVNGSESGERKDFVCKNSLRCGQSSHDSGGKSGVDEVLGNTSEPLHASLYLPRNDKLVKIDGNLIIHSVLASEKAMSSYRNGGGETGLAVPVDLGIKRNVARHPQLSALGSTSTHRDTRNQKASNGRLQQWFHEGFAGPMLSSGMCTEVFQFAVSSSSASGAIYPATTTRNISHEQNQTSTHLSKGRNRRILHGLPFPLPDSTHNISKNFAGRKSEQGNNSASPMVVSVLVDPREVGDADVDGVMGPKSISRIFVVLIDSVKYVTYSCVLPFMASAPHLVTS